MAIGGLLHPLLTGDGAEHLGTIAATAAWRGLHLALAGGFVLLTAGVASVAAGQMDPGARVAHAGALIFALGAGLALMQILFMLGSGVALASIYSRGDPGLSATNAVFVYDVIHPFAQASGRVGQFAAGLGLAVLGRALGGGSLPSWLGHAALGAGAGCAVWAVLVHEGDPRSMGGMGLVTVWAVVCGATLFAARRA